MINKVLFKKILEKSEEGYIEPSDYLDQDIIEFLHKYPSSKVIRLFKKSKKIVNKKTKKQSYPVFKIAVVCSLCRKKLDVEMVKTKVLEHIERQNYQCEECIKKRILKQEEEREYTITHHKKEIKKETEEFIKVYLSVGEYEWTKGMKPWEKLRAISQIDYLDTERIVETIQNLSYKDFLRTLYWQGVAHYIKHRAGYKCRICGGIKNLIAHHSNYEHHGYEHRYWKDDIICICKECHEHHHLDKSP